MRIVQLLYSVKLALVLIVLLILMAVIGGILPQGASAEGYYQMLPGPLAAAVLVLGLDHIFSSLPFLLVAALFLVNLTACTIRRFRGQLRSHLRGRRKQRNFGPDILHLGLIVLAVGGVLTAAGRQEHTFMLTPGDSHPVGEGYQVTLTDFEYQTYRSGAPKDWISTVRVQRGQELLHEAAEIEVNSPLRLGAYTLYQVRHARRPVARFSDGESRQLRLIAGQWQEVGDSAVLFAAVPKESGDSPSEGVFVLRKGGHRSVRQLSPGESLSGMELRSLQTVDITGLKAVRDPGYHPVLAGFILAGIGLVLTYAGKIVQLRRNR